MVFELNQNLVLESFLKYWFYDEGKEAKVGSE